ncbi:hypothetical protein JW752_02700 [Candidatus Peregrinibacteria bacterium]|nr:hypothetical protein [Candidatus Peregrinibacteria bacterium]
MDARRIQQINTITSITLILTIGLTSGYAIGFFRASQNRFPEIKIVDDVNPKTATIKLMEMKNGTIYGEAAGRTARIAYSADGIIDVLPGETFEIPISQIALKNYYQAGDIPENAQFAASKNGKYYYSVFDKRALNLKPENRIYFSGASEAEEMGYIKK